MMPRVSAAVKSNTAGSKAVAAAKQKAEEAVSAAESARFLGMLNRSTTVPDAASSPPAHSPSALISPSLPPSSNPALTSFGTQIFAIDSSLFHNLNTSHSSPSLSSNSSSSDLAVPGAQQMASSASSILALPSSSSASSSRYSGGHVPTSDCDVLLDFLSSGKIDDFLSNTSSLVRNKQALVGVLLAGGSLALTLMYCKHFRAEQRQFLTVGALSSAIADAVQSSPAALHIAQSKTREDEDVHDELRAPSSEVQNTVGTKHFVLVQSGFADCANADQLRVDCDRRQLNGTNKDLCSERPSHLRARISSPFSPSTSHFIG